MLTKILVVVGLLILLVLVVGLVVGYTISAPHYEGPISDHFDGREFLNLGGAKAKGFREVIGWIMNRGQTPWGAFHTNKPGPPPPARVNGREVRVTFVNHSTVLLQFDGLNVLTDPVYYERVSPVQFAGPRRNSPPGIRFDDLPKIDVLLLSHNHWDHLDIETVKRLCARDQPKVFCPLGVKAFLKQHNCQNLVEMDWRQSVAFNAQTTIHCVPAQHFSGRGMFDRNATLWAGYVIDSQVAGKLYFAGDSGYGAFFRDIGQQFGPLRLALIPIGAYKPPWFMSPIHCSPAEAVQIHKDVRSEQSVAIHFGTFPLADDGEMEPVNDLQQALAEKDIPADRFRALTQGGSLVIE
ncbi:twin-arginine translocation pathway signal [Spirosoma taeanense]|uniref:Twin-arginine translocation pathway signal n=1 Tax=Spirosoma taeanense TaxID=2735870 RepID=A0A6M5Y4B5_9BACT|nr:MBL fold metallo-hydrolase [Spirosoma taeanense]QJW88031.1 twin-arginine translocation pathway signal [Spirosoma taeanense]